MCNGDCKVAKLRVNMAGVHRCLPMPSCVACLLDATYSSSFLHLASPPPSCPNRLSNAELQQQVAVEARLREAAASDLTAARASLAEAQARVGELSGRLAAAEAAAADKAAEAARAEGEARKMNKHYKLQVCVALGWGELAWHGVMGRTMGPVHLLGA